MPKIKRIIQVALLIIVVGSVGYLIAKEMIRAKEPPRTAVTAEINVRPDHIVAYYFHGNFRCVNCRKIESYSKESIDDNFASELKSGVLSFKVINVEEPENRHYVNDYGLYTKSLIVASYAGDKQIRYKNLARVWNYLGSKDEFESYVKTEVSDFLSEVKK